MICHCGRTYRKGTVVTLVSLDGSTKRARVCPECLSRALVLVVDVGPYLKALDDVPTPRTGRQ